MKFLKKARHFTGIPSGVYTTILRRAEYIRLKATGEICGMKFVVAYPEIPDRDTAFVVFSQHLAPLLDKLCRDLHMRPPGVYTDGQEGEFLSDLNSRLPAPVELRVLTKLRNGLEVKRYYLTGTRKTANVVSQ
jgi:hypothetical protein